MQHFNGADVDAIRSSDFFDAEWYLDQYPDVKALGMDPAEHYLWLGARIGRDPSPMFDSLAYLSNNPDVAAENINPLLHYTYWGKDEGRSLTFRLPMPDSGEALSATLQNYISQEYGDDHIDVYRHLFSLIERYNSDQQSFAGGADGEVLCRRISSLERALDSSSQDIKASIIIPVYNNVLYTLTCVASILEASANHRFEILIADDNSTDKTADLLDGLGPVVRHIRHETNKGFLENCNAAATFARGEYVVLLNNDTIVMPGWLDAMIETFESEPSAGLVGSKLLNGDGTLQEAGGIFWCDGSAWNFGRGDDALDPAYNYTKDIDYCSGASIGLPRALWQELGGFDTLFSPAYCEDSDIAFRVRAAGRRTVYQPASALVHHEGVTHGKDVSQGIKQYQEINNRKLLERWRPVLERDNFLNNTNVFLARDRSANKPHILIVDHYVPQFDKDAGSRTMFQYVRLFAESGFHVTFWPENLHRDAYARILQRMGVEVLYGPKLAGNFGKWFRENGRYFQYVLLSRAHVAQKFIEPLRQHSDARILFYGHDLATHRLRQEFEVRQESETLKEIAFWEPLEKKIWSTSDVILYPSEDECAVVRSEFPHKTVHPLIPYFFSNEEIHESDVRSGERRTLLFIGGFGHRPNADAVIWFASDVFPQIRDRLPNVKFVVAGSNPPDEVMQLASPGIDILGYVSDERLRELYEEARIVVVPLRFGGGVKGKVIEAMRYGVPLVTTSIGIQGYPEFSGFMAVADEPEEFAGAVVDLFGDDARRAEFARAGTAFIRSHFSAEAARQNLGKEIPELLVRS